MNAGIYENIVGNYQKDQRKKMLIFLGVAVLGFLLAATGIGVFVGVAALICLMMAAVRVSAASNVRKASIRQLRERGLYDSAMYSLQTADRQVMDGLTYAWSDDFFYTGYGAIFPMKEVAWVYPFTNTVRYMMIPIMKQHCCKIRMLDGTEKLVFHGKAKEQEAFRHILEGMLSVNPGLLIGYTQENAAIYQQRTALYKASRNG